MSQLDFRIGQRVNSLVLVLVLVLSETVLVLETEPT